MHKTKNSGFTLFELVLYVGIFSIVAGLMVSILTTTTQVNTRETSSAELTGQLNFITQTIQRLVRSSSNIEIQPGISTSTLKLRMADPTKDPTCITLVNGVIKLAQGPDSMPAPQQNCTAQTSDLTSDRVAVNYLNFKKFTQYPGQDTVSIDVAITSINPSPVGQIQRTLSSAIARVSAATFDASVLPGTTNNYDLGQAGAPWRDVYLSGSLLFSGLPFPPTGVTQNGAIYYDTGSSTFMGFINNKWTPIGVTYWTLNSSNGIYNNNSSGKVGIGTTTPLYSLDVNGIVNASAVQNPVYAP